MKGENKNNIQKNKQKNKSGKRDSNSRPQPWQGCALPTELFPQFSPESPPYSQILPRLSPISNFMGQGYALPTELFPQLIVSNEFFAAQKGKQTFFCSEEEETRTPTSQLTLPPQSSASTNSATSPLQVFLMPYGAQNRSRTCTPRGTRT